MDKEFSLHWLKYGGDLHAETEGMLLAAQDQALPTRSIQHLYDEQCPPVCRLCGEQTETTEHIICGCKFLAATQYKSRHDSVAKIVHLWLCQAT